MQKQSFFKNPSWTTKGLPKQCWDILLEVNLLIDSLDEFLFVYS